MKMKITIALALFAVLTLGLFHLDSISAVGKSDEVQHIVLFAFKADTPKEKIDEIIKAAVAMPQSAPMIESMEWGSEINQMARSQGYSHCLNMHFKSKADLDAYLPSPTHEAFKKLATPSVEKLLVFDYHPKQ